MIHRTRIAALVLSLLLALPSVSLAERDGHGGKGHSRGGGHSMKGGPRGGDGHVRHGGRGRSHDRGGGGALRWKSGDRGGSGPKSYYRGGGGPGGSRPRTHYRDGGGSRSANRVRYRHDGGYSRDWGYRRDVRVGGYYSYYRPRYYYTGHFHRPRFHHAHGFTLGLVIGAVPSYGYSYFDPYCRLRFHSLDSYYGHCHEHGHSHAILVIDLASRGPVATCIYRGGDWVVDDFAYDY